MREPYFSDSDMTLYQGDAVQVLRDLPAGSVHMACTSPPFFGLRDYGTGAWEGGDEGCHHAVRPSLKVESSTLGGGTATTGHQREGYGAECGRCGARRIDSQIGLESSPDEWAARLVDVFREVRRVLRDDGTLWVECGDSYAGGGHAQPQTSDVLPPSLRDGPGEGMHGDLFTASRRGNVAAPHGTKPKDLIGQPWLLAFALRADGWYLRSCIIWSKPNAMPESVTDRPTTGHSYAFLFSKKPRYFYDAEALREPLMESTIERSYTAAKAIAAAPKNDGDDRARKANGWEMPTAKNARTVWTIPTEPNALAICRVCDAYWQGGAPREHCGEPVVQHFAAFPRELVRRMILAGTSERGVCAECGAPWVREVEERSLERHELSKDDPRYRPARYEGKYDELHGGNNAMRYHESETTGWTPTCACAHASALAIATETAWHPAGPVPAVVLDCFSGSGTTLLVARSLGRHAIGVELNEHYCAMTKARTHQLSVLG